MLDNQNENFEKCKEIEKILDKIKRADEIIGEAKITNNSNREKMINFIKEQEKDYIDIALANTPLNYSYVTFAEANNESLYQKIVDLKDDLHCKLLEKLKN